MLLEVTQRAKEAEKIKESVSKVKTKAEKIVARIETEKVILIKITGGHSQSVPPIPSYENIYVPKTKKSWA